MYFCKSCNLEFSFIREKIKEKSNGDISIWGGCPKCNTWWRWVAYRDSYIVKCALKHWNKEHKTQSETMGE